MKKAEEMLYPRKSREFITSDPTSTEDVANVKKFLAKAPADPIFTFSDRLFFKMQ